MNKVVAIANDHAGVALKAALLPEIAACGFTALDLGTNSADSVDYPDYGDAVANAIIEGDATWGIIICGSGIGISIAANRHCGIRAALCSSAELATLARQHNDANVLALGARFISETAAKECVKQFLTTRFDGGERHERRVEKLG
jgi:ribose 5-phosphate isomerase B